MHMGKIPFTLLIFPFNESSPTNAILSNSLFFIISIDIKIPTAIGKSKLEPSFFVSAGAKFTTIFLL